MAASVRARVLSLKDFVCRRGPRVRLPTPSSTLLSFQLKALGPARWGAAPKTTSGAAGGAIWRRRHHLGPWNGKGKARKRRLPHASIRSRVGLPPGRTEGDVSRSS